MSFINRFACLSVIGAVALLGVPLSGVGSAMAQTAGGDSCGVEIQLADSASQGSNFTAALDEYILRHGYGCNATAVAGNTVLSATSIIERGSPNVISESWIDLINEIVEPGLAQGRIELGAKVLSDGGVVGWYVPRYTLEAHPEIKTIEDVLKRPDLFPNPENAARGLIHNGAEGWGLTTITEQLYKAYDADKLGFDLVITGSQAGLDGSIARAYERKLNWFGSYWEPNALLAKYDLVKLESEQPLDQAEWNRCITVAGCPDPKVSGWPVGRVYTVLSSDFVKQVRPDVLTYLKTRSIGNKIENEIFLWMDENQATGEQGAVWFLQNYPQIWAEWVSDEAQAKIKTSLP